MISSRLNFARPIQWRAPSLKYFKRVSIVQRRGLSRSFEEIKEDLLSRKLPLLHDAPTETPSYLLDATLADFLPPNPLSSYPVPPDTKEGYQTAPLRPGHHLVYFPPAYPLSSLLPDGTDPEQSPGEPFARRMWAGGRIQFFPRNGYKFRLTGHKATCFERISDVVAKGKEEEEKIFVTVERRFTGHKRVPVSEGIPIAKMKSKFFVNPLSRFKDDSLREVLLSDRNCSLIEQRDIVFMRKKVPQSTADDTNTESKVIKYPHESSHSVVLIPTPSLLFRFSALTFNAHRIHLDKEYCREAEGHRNLLVHGPLSVVLMLEVLQRYLADQYGTQKLDSFALPKIAISAIKYRNIAPLYAEEPLKVCLRDLGGLDFDVWVENKDGGISARGTASTEAIGGFMLPNRAH